ncbi:MAG: MlaD family protein [Phycisphaerales bacterium]
MPEASTSTPVEGAPELPSAIVTLDERRAEKLGPAWLPWLAPAAAALLVVAIVAQAVATRGERITLRFSDGHGLKAGDPVMHRGVQVGRIRSAGVAPADRKAVFVVDLDRSAAPLATGGRFWIVRPELSLSRIAGLETIVGPRYLAADLSATGNSAGPLALEAPPTDAIGDGLRLTVRAVRAGSLAAGSPVSFREMQIGEVTGVSLTPDARSVEIMVFIEPEHARLVRPTTRFWNVSGIGLDLGFVGGLKLKAESLRTILSGGLALATPERPAPGEPVKSGHEFVLSEFEEEFTRWAPDLGTGSP